MSLLNDTSSPPPDEELAEGSKEIAEGYKRIVLIPEIRQMMFVAGETGEPSSETTTLIEQIVHEQVIEMVSLRVSCACEANIIIAQKIHSPCYSTRLPYNHHLRFVFPNPPRQSKDFSLEDISLLERCPKER